MSASGDESSDGADGDDGASGACEIGSLPMPPAEWLFAAAASFQQSYGQVHPYLATVLCIVGTLMNGITVLVLTRPSMRSPVNVLLCAVALCDIVVMSSYLVFVQHFLLAANSRCEPGDFSYGWALFMMFHAHASVIFHAASIWMTVSLALIRVLTIRRATAGPSTPLITERFTAVLALITCLLMTLIHLPTFLTFEIMEVPSSAMLSCLQPPDPDPMMDFPQEAEMIIPQHTNPINISSSDHQIHQQMLNYMNNSSNATGNHLTAVPRMRRHHRRFRRGAEALFGPEEEPFAYTVRAHESDCMKFKLAFWSNGMIFKVIPCLLLSLSIWALLRIIADVAHKRKNLAQVMRKKVPKDHTTPMLAAILLIFLLAELPQGLFLVLNGIFSSGSFHKRVYQPLGDLMDLLSLLNSAVGFFIYVAMSRKFRTVLLQLLFSALACITSSRNNASERGKPGEAAGRSRTAEPSGTSQQCRRRGDGDTNAEQHSWRVPEEGMDAEAGGRSGNEGRRRGGGGGARKPRWMMGWGRRRGGGGRRKMSWKTATTDATKTEQFQLSMCASQSLLGLPPLTLAVSCSAGITAAAASVGVHLLQLDPPAASGCSGPSRSPSPCPGGSSGSRRCSARLTLPASNAATRRISNGSANNLLAVPGKEAEAEDQQRSRKDSFLSLKDEQHEGRRRRSMKRISFNLPIQREEDEEERMMRRKKKRKEEEDQKEDEVDEGFFPAKVRRSLNSLTIVRQLRRWSAEGEHHDHRKDVKVEEEKKAEEDDEDHGTTTGQNGNCRREAEEALSRIRKKKHIRKGVGGGGGGTFERIRKRWGREGEGMRKKDEEEEDEEERKMKKRKEEEHKRMNPGSASPQRKECAMRTETNFIGWTYC